MELTKKEIIQKTNFFRKYFDFPNYNLVSWFHLITLILSGISPILSVTTAIVAVFQTNDGALLWFTNFDTFTYQSNLIVSTFVWLLFWRPNLKIFQTHTLMMTIMVYIFITFTFFNTYDLMITFGDISTRADSLIDSNPNNLASVENLYKISSIWNHIINPLFFITFGFICITKERKSFISNIYEFISLSMIYPLIYTIYLIFIPWSGYLDDGNASYSVYGAFTQTKYNNLTCLWFPPLLAVFPISLTIIWHIKAHVCHKEKIPF